MTGAAPVLLGDMGGFELRPNCWSERSRPCLFPARGKLAVVAGFGNVTTRRRSPFVTLPLHDQPPRTAAHASRARSAASRSAVTPGPARSTWREYDGSTAPR